MATLITGVLGLSILFAFLIGLAFSIGSVPFSIIVAIVLTCAFADFLQTILRDRARRNG